MITEQLWYDFRNFVYLKDFARAEDILKGSPTLTNARNSIGETVLHFLAVEDNLDGVAWLHEHGFNLDVKNDFGTPMVFEVATLGYRDLLTWLAHHDVDFFAVDADEQNIFEHLHNTRRGEETVQFLRDNFPALAKLSDAPER